METPTQQQLKSRYKYYKSSGMFRYIRLGAVREIAGKKSNGYLRLSINGEWYGAHRLAWLYEYGEMPNSDLDHINHLRDDNRIVNLRFATPLENNKNQSLRTDNKSGHVGVGWHKANKIWVARIRIKTKSIYLGSYHNIEDAIEARSHASKLYGFHSNHGK